MPDGSHDARAARQARLEAELAAARARFEAETPEPTAEELEELERQARERHGYERRARAQYRPRASDEQHAHLIQSLPMWYIVQVKPNITPAELRVLAVLRFRARPERPRAQIARSELAKIARVSDRHALRCLYELREAGFLKPWIERRISRDQSEVNTYELEPGMCWPRTSEAPAEATRQIRRARYDKNVTPSGCPTDTSGSTREPETPTSSSTPRERPARRGGEPPGGVDPDGRLAPAGALGEGRTRNRRANQATAPPGSESARDPRVVDLEELLASSSQPGEPP